MWTMKRVFLSSLLLLLLLLLAPPLFHHLALHLNTPSSTDYKASLAGKRVLLCGIGYEVGEQLAYQLASHGAKLVIFYRADGRQKTLLNLQKTFELTDDVIQIIQPLMVARTDTKAMEIKETAMKLGSPQTEIFPFNFGNTSSAHLVVDTAMSLLGGLDYVILNQADVPRGFFLHSLKLQNQDFLHRTFSVNLYSYIEIALRALPHLEKTSGHMFVSSSVLGEVPEQGLSVFSSTKHALRGFFTSLQLELEERMSGVGLTVGTLGVMKSTELRALLDVPEYLMGDISEGAVGVMNSIVKRQKSFVYPAVHTYFAKLLWAI